MRELLWKISFGMFLAAVPVSVAHAVIVLGMRKGGSEREGRRLVWLRRAANAAIVAGMAALAGYVATRWVETGHPPFSNIPESLSWMALGFCAVYLVARAHWDFPGMEAGACAGALAILAFSALFKDAAGPLVPALQSNWLVFHVFTCMVSYGAFLAAFCMAVLWLALWRKRESGRLVDRMSYHLMAFGFLLLTIGIISGAVWARQAWGRYWGWDPKETWSLITWFVYGSYLHFRRIASALGVSEERLPAVNAVFAVVGFAFVLFTYLGVSYLLPSLHSYASG
ncbi:MAG: cytochrome c biogenesis protein CcsA [Planctomycetota bacterium]